MTPERRREKEAMSAAQQDRDMRKWKKQLKDHGLKQIKRDRLEDVEQYLDLDDATEYEE